MFKFDTKDKTVRKQWFYSEQDDYELLRKDIYNFTCKICDYLLQNKNKKVLEVGPSEGVYNELAFPHFNGNIRQFCGKNNITYKTCDIDPNSGCDYICPIENAGFIKEKFDIVIIIDVLEHVEKLFQVPQSLYNICNENALVFIHTPYMFKVHGPIPDCWRLTEYGYRALFSGLFSINEIEAFPPGELGKNSFPLSFSVTLKRK